MDGFNEGAKKLKYPELKGLESWARSVGLGDSWFWEEYKPSGFFPTLERLLRTHGRPLEYSIPPKERDPFLNETNVHVLRTFFRGRAVRVVQGQQTFVVVVLDGVFKRQPDLKCLVLFDARGRPLDTVVGEAEVLDHDTNKEDMVGPLFTFRTTGGKPFHKIVIRHGRFVDLLNHPN